jgi:hypothetical protein
MTVSLPRKFDFFAATSRPTNAESVVSAGHRFPEFTEVIATPILGGLHHEYRLPRHAA